MNKSALKKIFKNKKIRNRSWDHQNKREYFFNWKFSKKFTICSGIQREV